jgi:mannose/fructose/N-acetylgalactosamine-specific phosphotransferase system component IIC
MASSVRTLAITWRETTGASDASSSAVVGSIIVIVSDIKEEQPLAVVSQDILLIAVVAEPLSAALGQLSLVRQGTIDQTVSHTIRHLLQQYTFCNLLISTTISDDGKIAIWV